MRPLLMLPLALGLVVVFSAPARAQMGKEDEPKKEKTDEPKKEKDDKDDDDDKPAAKGDKLPWNPFAEAQKADWAVFNAVAKQMGTSEKAVLTFRVKKAEEEEVKIAVEEKSKNPDAPQAPKKFSKKGDVFLADFFLFPIPGVKEFKIVKSEEEKKKVGDKEFDCTKIKFKSSLKGPQGEIGLNGTYWLSKGVKGMGLVAMTLKLGTGEQELVGLELELAGYGNKDKADWGKNPEDVVKAFEAGNKDDDDDGKKDEPKKDDGKKDDGKKDKEGK